MVETGVPPVTPDPRPVAARSGRSSPLYVGLLLAAAVAYYLYSRKGRAVPELSYRSCSARPSAEERLRVFSDLHGFHYAIQTTSSKAQALFDQGLLLAWDFNQPEAEIAFKLGLAADANASMLHWGIQQVIGPGANRAVLPERPLYPAFAPDNFADVYSAATLALHYAQEAASRDPDSATARRDLAFAEAAVLRWPQGSEYGPARDAAEKAYSAAMGKFGEENGDPAALAIAGEALMNLHPWEYYLPDGSMKPTAVEAERLILAALKLNVNHPLANHLHIHISEASSTSPDAPLSAHRALASANRLTYGNGPWKAHQGHLLHMPSHTFIRTGKYHDAVLSNVHAYNADLVLGQHCMQPYEPEHNTDMLIFAASLGGEMKVAEEFALKIQAFGKAMYFEGWQTQTVNWAKFPLLLAHFARWSEVMKLGRPGPEMRANCPAGGYEFVQVVWRYVRVLALAAKAEGARLSQNNEEFRQTDAYLDSYLQVLQEAESKVVAEEPVFPPAVYLCEHKGLANIYVLTAQARVALLRNQTQEAIAKLREAVDIEAKFAYMEPPRVYQPTRQCLGYVLLQANQPAEAEKVYRADLGVLPENGWSLHGLSDALHRQGMYTEVDTLRPRVQRAWKHADRNVESSCPAFSSPWGAPILK